MKFQIEILSKIREPGFHEHDRDGWIAHFDALMEALIGEGAEDPAVDADFDQGVVEITFVAEGESDAEAIQTGIALFIRALKASGAEVGDVSVDQVRKGELVSA